MRSIFIAVLVVVGLLIGLANPVQAQLAVADSTAIACSNNAGVAVKSGYAYPDFGVMATKNPVLQADYTLTCGAWSYGLWASKDLTTSSFGSKSFGDEVDFSLSYANTFGGFDFSFTGAYYLSTEFGKFGDDFIDLHVGLGRTFDLGWVSITPGVEVTEFFWVDGSEKRTFIRPAVGFSIPLSDGLAFEAELAEGYDFATGMSVFQPSASLQIDFANQWSANIGWETTNRDTVSIFGVRISKSW